MKHSISNPTMADIEWFIQENYDISDYDAYKYAQEAVGTPDPLNPDNIAAFMTRREAEEAENARWDEVHQQERQEAHDAGNDYPTCDIERYCRENGVESPTDMEAASATFTREFKKRWAATRNTAYAIVWFGVLNDWREGKLQIR